MAGNDKYFKKNCNDDYINALLKKKTKVDLLIHESGNHFFDMDNDNVRTREIILKTVGYFKTELK